MSIQTKNKTQAGFSLVESIIYLALFVMLSTLLIDCMIVMSKSYVETRANRDLLDSMNIPLERMTRDIRGASTVVFDSSTVFGTNPGSLKIRNSDGTTETFAISGGAISFVDTDGTSNNITSNQVVVDSLIFRNISTSAGSAVKIEMTLHSLRSASHRSISLSDTVVLRGEY
ncbi:MAG: hypothetical protein WCO65_00045 [bacterium]